MKQRGILLMLLVPAVVGAFLVLEFSAAIASSHREAPAILSTPQVDGTDFYMFRSYEEGRDGFVTLISNYIPLQDPYGGPNYFALDPDAFYDIHVTNDGDVDEDLTFRFQIETALTPFNLNIDDENVDVPLVNVGPFGAQGQDALTQRRSYSLRLLRGNVEDPDSIEFVTNVDGGATRFGMPFDNIGGKSIPDYASYADLFIHDIDIPGCDPGRVFVGQRKESFAVNLGEVFDLVNITNPVGNPDAERSDTADKNITSFALEVPIDCLTGDSGEVIGGWTTASLRRNRTLINNPTFEAPDEQAGDLVQVSRLANPLVNEVAIGLPDKNLFNASHPRNDGSNFLQYVTNPSLPELVEILFPNVLTAPNNFPREDLVQTYLTGFPGLNEDGSVGEIMRLNTAVDPAPRGQQNRLGVIGGDPAGYPNGRRPGDDAVDISLRVLIGNLCHQGGGGSSNEFTVTLNGGNVVPPTSSTANGTGVFNLIDGNRLQGVVNHNVQNVFEGSIRRGAAGQNGDRVCRDDTGPTPIRWENCVLDSADIQALFAGDLYVNVHSVNFPNGEIRGQLLAQSTGVGGCTPADAPSGAAPLTDGAYQGPFQFDDAFPYLRTPCPGSPREARPRTANLIDDNLELIDPFEPTDAGGFCEISRLLGDLGFELRCSQNVPNPLELKITKDGPDGEVLWLSDLVSDPPTSTGTIIKVLDGTNYLGSEPLEIFADGFESGDVSAWSTVEGNPTKIGGPFR